MKIVVPKERTPLEQRVAATPETVKKMTGLGHKLLVESNAGLASGYDNASYETSGASIVSDINKLYSEADIVLKVQCPSQEEIEKARKGTFFIGFFQARFQPDFVKTLNARQLNAFSLDGIPRIARAQKMDVLSSQSNVAGYKSVLIAADRLKKMMPLMMTAAGTITPAKVFILGAGVAGLQAIATAKRLGAVVEAFDTRPVVKEQVESLGGKFLQIDLDGQNSEDKGGYAKELSQEAHRKEVELVDKHASEADIVITTALIPGKPAPLLITEDTVKKMKPGSVIVDLAAETGGNCQITEKDKEVVKHGIIVMGHTQLPSMAGYHASQLYARNLLNFLAEIVEDGRLNINLEDEVIKGALATNPQNIETAVR